MCINITLRMEVYTKIEESTEVGVMISSIVRMGKQGKEMLHRRGL